MVTFFCQTYKNETVSVRQRGHSFTRVLRGLSSSTDDDDDVTEEGSGSDLRDLMDGLTLWQHFMCCVLNGPLSCDLCGHDLPKHTL